MSLYIKDQSYFIPNEHYDLAKDAHLLGLDANMAKVYTRFYGLKKIPRAQNISLETMIEQAIRPLLYEKEKIKYLIHTHTMPILNKASYSTVRNIRNLCALNNTNYFSVTMNKCTSTIKAFEILDNLLHGEEENTALICSGEIIFNSEFRIMPNITITADASAALVVSNKTGHSQLISIATHTYGQYAKGSWANASENLEFSSNYNSYMSEIIDTALSKAGISKNKLALILPANDNIPGWKKFARFYHYPFDKIYLKNISRFAHCFNSDLAINLSTALQEKALNPGNYFLMVTAGIGAVFAAALFQYQGEKNDI